MAQVRPPLFGIVLCSAFLCHAEGQQIHLNKYRHYYLHVPSGYKKGMRLPVWILAPGSSDTSSVMLQMSNAVPLAEKYKFALAVLEGSHLNLNVASHGQPVPWGPDDLLYTKMVLRDVIKRIDISLERIRCVGFSRGGRFCSRLASELSSFVSAIAPVSGIRFPEPNNATRPMPIITFHGTTDPINPFKGNGNPEYWHEPVLSAVQRWADKNGCTRYHEQKMSPTVTYCMHLDCEDNADVILVQILKGGHTWPGTTWDYRPTWRFGMVSRDIDATLDIFHFFQAHHRPSRCHTAVKGEQCYEHVQWVRLEGLRTQPLLYGDLKNTSSDEEIQLFLRKNIYANCPEPCRQTPVLVSKRTEVFVGRAEQPPVHTPALNKSLLGTMPAALAGTVMGLLAMLAAVAIVVRLRPWIRCAPDDACTAAQQSSSRPQPDDAPLMEEAKISPDMSSTSGSL